MLINAVKDVTSALGDLMQATKSASGKNMQHPAMITLKDTAKVRLASAALICSATSWSRMKIIPKNLLLAFLSHNSHEGGVNSSLLIPLIIFS